MACKICRITIMDFMFSQNTPDGYDEWDLENGIQWCKEMIDEGFVNEPMDDFNLSGYIKWAENKLNNKEEVTN